MIFLNKYEQVEYWLYTAYGSVYRCEQTGDGLVWYDSDGWALESEIRCEKLTNARNEALAKMPKRVEFEFESFEDVEMDYHDSEVLKNAYYRFKREFVASGKVKIIIKEVQE